MIRILVVDDHPIVREGLVMILRDQPDFEVVGAVGSAEEAIELVPQAAPSILLLDLELPGLSGVDAVSALVRAHPETRVLVFTAYSTDERVLGAIRAGAKGYLLKGTATPEIAAAVRTVYAGGSHLQPSVAAQILARAGETPPPTVQLSNREREVLRLVAAGQPGKQIARSLSISERTVKFHMNSILTKLGAESRAQAVAIAVQRGLL